MGEEEPQCVRETYSRTSRASRLQTSAGGPQRWQVHVRTVSCLCRWRACVEFLPHLNSTSVRSPESQAHAACRHVLSLIYQRFFFRVLFCTPKWRLHFLSSGTWKGGRSPPPASKKRRGSHCAPRRAHSTDVMPNLAGGASRLPAPDLRTCAEQWALTRRDAPGSRLCSAEGRCRSSACARPRGRTQ